MVICVSEQHIVNLQGIVQLLLVMARCSGALWAAPAFGVRNVPLAAFTIVVLSCSAAMVHLVPIKTDMAAKVLALPNSPSAFVSAVVCEFLIGMLIGFFFSLIVRAFECAGQIADIQIGFAFGAYFDVHHGERSAIISQAFAMLASVLFLALNGHHKLIICLSRSFQFAPIGSCVVSQSAWTLSLELLCDAVLWALPIVMPCIGMVLFADVLLGFAGRAAPQLAITLWGMPIRVVCGLLAIIVSLGFVPRLCETLLWKVFEVLPVLLSSIAR